MSKNIIGDGLAVTYLFYTFQVKLDNMSRQIDSNMSELQGLIEIHEEESEIKMAEMQETIKWYQGQLNVNPLSWGKKNK